MTSSQQTALDALKADCRLTIELASGYNSPWTWTDEYDEDGMPIVSQGDFLGETLIELSDTYEGCRQDCGRIQHAVIFSPSAARRLLTAIEALEKILFGGDAYISAFANDTLVLLLLD